MHKKYSILISIILLFAIVIGFLFFFLWLFLWRKNKQNFKIKTYEISSKPAAFPRKVYKNVIPKHIRDQIREEMKTGMINSTLVSDTTIDNKVRKSKTKYHVQNKELNNIVHELVAPLVNLPVSYAEPIQLLEYEPNGFYKPHYDSCCDNTPACKEFLKKGQRLATGFCRISEEGEYTGGETWFQGNTEEGIDVTLEPGDCVVFANLDKSGKYCPKESNHGGKPVKSGNKKAINVWFRDRPWEK